jgi:hypothetical protein
MHGVLEKIEQQEGRHKAQPLIGDRPGGQGHTEGCFELRPKGVRRREGEGGEDYIEEPDAEIAKPPPYRRKLTPPSRPAEFPNRDGEQATNNYDEGQLHLLIRLAPHFAHVDSCHESAFPIRA